MDGQAFQCLPITIVSEECRNGGVRESYQRKTKGCVSGCAVSALGRGEKSIEPGDALLGSQTGTYHNRIRAHWITIDIHLPVSRHRWRLIWSRSFAKSAADAPSWS